MKLLLAPVICTPASNSELFNYLYNKSSIGTIINLSQKQLKGFKIEPIFEDDTSEANIKYVNQPS